MKKEKKKTKKGVIFQETLYTSRTGQRTCTSGAQTLQCSRKFDQVTFSKRSQFIRLHYSFSLRRSPLRLQINLHSNFQARDLWIDAEGSFFLRCSTSCRKTAYCTKRSLKCLPIIQRQILLFKPFCKNHSFKYSLTKRAFDLFLLSFFRSLFCEIYQHLSIRMIHLLIDQWLQPIYKIEKVFSNCTLYMKV